VCARSSVPAAAWTLPPLLLATYITSFNVWRSPSTTTIWRYADYFMVAASVGYGTLVTKTCTSPAMNGLWCCGWGAVGAVFVANEARYTVLLTLLVQKYKYSRRRRCQVLAESDQIATRLCGCCACASCRSASRRECARCVCVVRPFGRWALVTCRCVLEEYKR
jgi:hypothetical protein